MNYQIVTVSNRTPYEWYYLQKQFYQSAPSEVLTINYTDSIWNGLATKPKWLHRAIVENLVTADGLVFVDSWDLVFGAPMEEIIEKHKYSGCDISISAEKNCFPDTYRKEFDELDTPAPYSYVNSGVIIGSKSAILACLDAMDLPNVADDYRMDNGQNYHSNDQTMWQEIFLKQPVKIWMDYDQQICQTLHDAKISDFDLSEKRIINKITNSDPCIWHFNGGSKDNMELREPILKHLNLL